MTLHLVLFNYVNSSPPLTLDRSKSLSNSIGLVALFEVLQEASRQKKEENIYLRAMSEPVEIVKAKAISSTT